MGTEDLTGEVRFSISRFPENFGYTRTNDKVRFLPLTWGYELVLLHLHFCHQDQHGHQFGIRHVVGVLPKVQLQASCLTGLQDGNYSSTQFLHQTSL